MVSQRASKSAGVPCQGSRKGPAFRASRAHTRSDDFAGVLAAATDPAARVVMLEILPPRDPAEDHRLRDPPLLGPHGEVDVRDDEADQPDAGHAVRDVDESPGRIAEQIRIAR